MGTYFAKIFFRLLPRSDFGTLRCETWDNEVVETKKLLDADGGVQIEQFPELKK